MSFLHGDRLLLCTDGVTEARDVAGRFCPLADRAHLLKERDPQAVLEMVRQDLLQHVSVPLHDDAAMLCSATADGWRPCDRHTLRIDAPEPGPTGGP